MSWLAVIGAVALLFTCLLVFTLVVIVAGVVMFDSVDRWGHNKHLRDAKRIADGEEVRP
jgi:hypothetical protein